MSQWTDRWDKQQASLGNAIIACHKGKRFLQDIAIAERGYGKSTYHIQTMAYVYYHLVEKNETNAWNYALDNMIFLPSQLEDRIDYNEEQDICDMVWCLDDAAVHFSNKLWWTEQAEAILLEGIFDLIRPVVSAVLVNCPEKERLLGSLQRYYCYEDTIVIAEGGGHQRITRGIKWYRLPSGQRRWRKVWDDEFSCYIPNWVYDKYKVTRRGYIRKIREKLRERRDKMAEKNTPKNKTAVDEELDFPHV